MSAEALPRPAHRTVSKPPIYQRYGRVFLAYGILLALLLVYQAKDPILAPKTGAFWKTA